MLGLGLPDVNELGWRFADSLIYLTRKTPNEPTFRTTDFVPELGPVPLAAIHSTRDEFVPLDEIRGLMALPGGPKRLWIIAARNHRFSDDGGEFEKRFDEAREWIRQERR